MFFLKKLLENTFSEYSLVEQLLMISIFIQDQTRLMNKKNLSGYSNKKFIIGLKRLIWIIFLSKN